MKLHSSLLITLCITTTLCITFVIAQKLETAEGPISRDRALRQSLLALGRRPAATPPKPGFFGTIVQLISDQANDTKSAYRQISTLINDNFIDENEATKPPVVVNGTTAAPTKISRSELLKILDRNLKGLRRLRQLEWREAVKDSRKNIIEYKEQAFGSRNLVKKSIT